MSSLEIILCPVVVKVTVTGIVVPFIDRTPSFSTVPKDIESVVDRVGDQTDVILLRRGGRRKGLFYSSVVSRGSTTITLLQTLGVAQVRLHTSSVALLSTTQKIVTSLSVIQ